MHPPELTRTRPEKMTPSGTIIFSVVGRTSYGFDVFSVKIPSTLSGVTHFTERRLTDGVSVNFNGQFLDETGTVAYVTERTGSARIFLTNPDRQREPLPSVSESLFHDRPVVVNRRLYFVSAHEPANKLLTGSAAVYSTRLDKPEILRLTPYGTVDYSPAVSKSGKFVAVASYGSRPWAGDFHDLQTEIVVFPESDTDKRTVLCKRGGWPTWSGDSTVFFHRKVEDGWWSVFRADLPEKFENFGKIDEPRRVTPPGLHAFTPSASHNGKWIAIATRRPGNEFRHVEVFDLEAESFYRVTERINPNFHHYNPFFSPESGFLGYHRFRGESDSESGESTIPHLEPVSSPLRELEMVRVNGFFPSVSSDGDFIAMNQDFGGLQILRSDGSKKWKILKDRIAFQTSWSPTEKGVIYTSVGPIFELPRTPVQIARISIDLSNLDDREEVPAKVKILTNEDTGNNAFPSCSSDGKFLVFRSGRSGHKNLYIVDATDGESAGEARRLTDGPWIDTMPSWSPDGKLIAFSSNRHNPGSAEGFSIYLIRPDGTELRRVYVAGKEGSADVDKERINHVTFSPDAKWLLFTANLGGVSAEPVSLPNQFQPYGELYICRLDGSEVQRLTWNAYEDGTPTWHSFDEVDIEKLSLETPSGGEKLRGQFEEPLWLTFPA